MKIAVAQINVTVGDFAGNAAKIRQAVDTARAAGSGNHRSSQMVSPSLRPSTSKTQARLPVSK